MEEAGRHQDQDIQTLHLPDDLERKLNSLSTKCRTWIQETGINVLHTERAIREHGPKGALIRTVRSGKKTDGLMLLAKHNRLDCAYEQIAIDHADEMPSDVVEIARRTLANFGAS